VVGAGDLEDDEIVTQTGHCERRSNDQWYRGRFSFRRALRADLGEKYMSVIRGRLTPAEAVPLVARGDRAGFADAVRYASIGELRQAGFTVEPKENHLIPGHLGVFLDREWTPADSDAFDRCFSEIVPGKLT
jgi:hypothetical protein